MCFTGRVICSDYPPLQPFPLQEAREVHGLVVGGKRSSTQIITNYSVGEGERKSFNNKEKYRCTCHQKKMKNRKHMYNFCTDEQTSGLRSFTMTTNTRIIHPLNLKCACVCLLVFVCSDITGSDKGQSHCQWNEVRNIKCV